MCIKTSFRAADAPAIVFRAVSHEGGDIYRWRERAGGWRARLVAEGTCNASDLPADIAERARLVRNDFAFSPFIDWPA